MLATWLFISPAFLRLLLRRAHFNFATPTPALRCKYTTGKEQTDKNRSLGRSNPPGSTSEIPLLASLGGFSLHNPALGGRGVVPSRQVQKLAGAQLWSREGTEQPVPPVSAFFLIRD